MIGQDLGAGLGAEGGNPTEHAENNNQLVSFSVMRISTGSTYLRVLIVSYSRLLYVKRNPILRPPRPKSCGKMGLSVTPIKPCGVKQLPTYLAHPPQDMDVLTVHGGVETQDAGKVIAPSKGVYLINDQMNLVQHADLGHLQQDIGAVATTQRVFGIGEKDSCYSRSLSTLLCYAPLQAARKKGAPARVAERCICCEPILRNVIARNMNKANSIPGCEVMGKHAVTRRRQKDGIPFIRDAECQGVEQASAAVGSEHVGGH